MNPTSSIAGDEHHALAGLLPWYAENTLSKEEHAMVEAHLAHCTQCQQELTGWRQLSGGVKALRQNEAISWQPSAAHFGKLSAKLDALQRTEQRRQSTAPGLGQRLTGLDRWRRVLDRLRDGFNIAPPGMRVAFVAQAVTIVALAGVLWQHAAGPQTYETLSREATTAVAAQGQLRIVFAEDATERDMREALQPFEGSIVAGPSPLAVYTVRISDAIGVEQVLQTLRANPKVRLAEANSARR